MSLHPPPPRSHTKCFVSDKLQYALLKGKENSCFPFCWYKKIVLSLFGWDKLQRPLPGLISSTKLVLVLTQVPCASITSPSQAAGHTPSVNHRDIIVDKISFLLFVVTPYCPPLIWKRRGVQWITPDSVKLLCQQCSYLLWEPLHWQKPILNEFA